MKELAQQEARRTGADNCYLCFHTVIPADLSDRKFMGLTYASASPSQISFLDKGNKKKH
jgi:hypothetical protein